MIRGSSPPHPRPWLGRFFLATTIIHALLFMTHSHSMPLYDPDVLSEQYGSVHPDFPVSDWKVLVLLGDARSYWRWVSDALTAAALHAD